MKTVNEPGEPLRAGDEELERMIDLETNGDSVATPEITAVPKRAPLPWIGAMPRSSYGVMAVVNKDGYLVPVWTAGDLLRACKMIWQATEE